MKAELIDLIKANLNDTRMLGVRLSLEELLVRDRAVGEVRLSRLYETGARIEEGGVVSDPIGGIDEFLTNLSEDGIKVSPYRVRGSNASGNVTSIQVTVTNMELHFIPWVDSDNEISNRMGNAYADSHICFVMGYMNDADETLPLKITSVFLTRR